MSDYWFVASRGRQSAVRALALNLFIASAAAFAAGIATVADAEAKGPGRTYCFLKKCHRVKTIAETQALVGRDMTVIASHYDDCKKDRFNPCGLTSSGEPFFPERADNAASPILPDGTVVLVWSKVSQEALVIRINNAGPYWGNRKLDLSRAAARKLGIGGVGEVTMRVLRAPTPTEARYSRNRRYERVPGPIGQFASLDAAHGAMSVMIAEGKAGGTALAGLDLSTKRDGTGNLASAFTSPGVAGFAMPKGALADALIAQTRIEQKSVTTEAPPSVNVVAAEQVSAGVATVTPKPTPVRTAAPRRTRVRAIEVKPATGDPLAVIAQAVTELFDPPKASKAARAVKSQRKIAKVRKARKTVIAQKARPAPRVRVAKPAPSQEFRAGHTTYAEDRYRKTVKAAAAPSGKAKSRSAKAGTATGVAPGGAVSTKQAGVARGKKSAALRKGGGWQSSAVFDVPSPRPALTGRPPWVPAGDMRDDTGKPQGPLRRVHPSALV